MDIIKAQNNLPYKPAELAKFILIGREKLNAIKGLIKAIDKLGLAADVRSQKKGEAVDLAEALLDAEVRMGELLKEIPKDNPNKRIGNAAESSKMKQVEKLGFNQTQAERFQIMAEHPEVVEQIKIEAREADDLPTRTAVLKEIKIISREADLKKQRSDIKEGKIILPKGLFEVVVIDPPWNYGREYDPENSRVANPYPEMNQEQLKEINLQASKNSCIFLWTTHAFIFDAKELLDHWGFEYKAAIVWDKEKIGMGAWLRMQCEFCLVGIKGKPYWSNTTWRDIIREPRREHSRKPESFYKMVEGITEGRRIEYFSRTQRKGWEAIGNDKEKF